MPIETLSPSEWPQGDIRPVATIDVAFSELAERLRCDPISEYEDGLGECEVILGRTAEGLFFVLRHLLQDPRGESVVDVLSGEGFWSHPSCIKEIIDDLGLTMSSVIWPNLAASQLEVHGDNMKFLDGDPIVVTAELELLDCRAGGRAQPITKNYRPNHNFGDESNKLFHIGQVELSEGEWLYPGQARIVDIKFLLVEGLKEVLNPGFRWRIQEGSHLVGHATVKALKKQ